MLNVGVVLRKLILAILLCLLASSVSAKDMVVVTSTSSGIQSLNQRQVKDIFLKKRAFVGENEVVAINLSANEVIRIVFEEKVLGMDRTEISSYWSAQHYQGVTPPLTQKSQLGLKAFLKNLKGSIGYMEKSQVENGLKVLYEF